MAQRSSSTPINANAFCCDTDNCGWQSLGHDFRADARDAARKHVDSTGHEVHIEIMVLETFVPGREIKNEDLNESDAKFISDSLRDRILQRRQKTDNIYVGKKEA